MPVLETKGALSTQGYGLTTTSRPQPAYIEDVFSTWLYTGNGAEGGAIVNGIDLEGRGGLVWLKCRDVARGHFLFDTARGANLALSSNSAGGAGTLSSSLRAFYSDGFALGSNGEVNSNAETYASWTFRKQPKFFDVVTYTGNNANRTIAHNLGSVPGCIIVKRLDAGLSSWGVYHSSLGNTQFLSLDRTDSVATNTALWNSTTPTSTVFSLGTSVLVNASGVTYVAYLFAHDAGGFGATGADNVISCGSYTGNGSATGPVVTLGYEPQWLLIKRATGGTGDWNLIDNMRGFVVGGTDAELNPNLINAESTGTFVTPTATGFQLNSTDAGYNANGNAYIYIAIRRGPMRTPTNPTAVFRPGPQYFGAGAPFSFNVSPGFVVDCVIDRAATQVSNWLAANRLVGATKYLSTNLTSAEVTDSGSITSFASQVNVRVGVSAIVNSSGETYTPYFFRRAPGFFDVVCYTGTGANTTQAHNLGAVPELIIVKGRSGATAWQVYSNILANTEYLVLNTTAAKATGATRWNSTTPTSSVFSLGTASEVNTSAGTYVAYLFATVASVSKVGSYTGTGATQTINCGFSSGARFVLIKRTDSTGDWYVWDSTRGIVAGNDPYLLLNSTAAEVTTTDWVDTAASGFELSNAAGNLVNTNGGSYIFLAIA